MWLTFCAKLMTFDKRLFLSPRDSGWYPVILGRALPLTECAPIGDRTSSIYGQVLSNEVPAHNRVQCQNYWDSTEALASQVTPCGNHLKLLPQVTSLESINRQLLKVCQPEPIREKVTERAPVSPMRKISRRHSPYLVYTGIELVHFLLTLKR